MGFGEIAAGVGVIGGLIQGNKADKRADEQLQAQREAMAAQQQSAAEQLAFQKQVYGDEMAFEDPLRKSLSAQALSGGDPIGWGQTKADIANQYGLAERRTETAMQRNGMLGSGLGASMGQAAQLKQASDLSRAYQQGMMNKRQMAASLLGNGRGMQAAQMVGNAYQGQSGMYGQQAGAFGNLAGMYGNIASQGYGMAGNALQNGLYMYGMGQGGGVGGVGVGTNSILSSADVPTLAPSTYDPSAMGLAPSTYDPSAIGLTPSTTFSTGTSDTDYSHNNGR